MKKRWLVFGTIFAIGALGLWIHNSVQEPDSARIIAGVDTAVKGKEIIVDAETAKLLYSDLLRSNIRTLIFRAPAMGPSKELILEFPDYTLEFRKNGETMLGAKVSRTEQMSVLLDRQIFLTRDVLWTDHFDGFKGDWTIFQMIREEEAKVNPLLRSR